MPALSEALSMQPGEIAVWAAVLVCAVAATVRVLDRQLNRVQAGPDIGGLAPQGYRAASRPGIRGCPNEPDALFWNVFTGLVVIVPALLIPAVASPVVGLLMLCLAAGAGLMALTGGRKLDLRRSGKPENRSGFEAASACHKALLERWQQYELDPAKAIDFPAMSDVRVPQTAELIRALREAQYCRTNAGTDYAAAVKRLEIALAEAERASGASAKTS
jgi:hypothetical protein